MFRYTFNCAYCQNSVCRQTYIHTDTHTHTHTHTRDNYCNPLCACAPRVNDCKIASVVCHIWVCSILVRSVYGSQDVFNKDQGIHYVLIVHDVTLGCRGSRLKCMMVNVKSSAYIFKNRADRKGSAVFHLYELSNIESIVTPPCFCSRRNG